jgi:SAPK-interacting protein 1 (Sin1), Pleckstrin-homology
MSLGRHERVLSIDGDYIHIMPSDKAKAAGRTASYHISHVSECKQNKRVPSTFKLIVWKDKDAKRYDFEAENSRQAGAFCCFAMFASPLLILSRRSRDHRTHPFARTCVPGRSGAKQNFRRSGRSWSMIV